MSLQHDIPQPVRRRPRRGTGRIYLVGFLMCIALVGLIVRLAMLQLVDGPAYAERARRQYEAKMTLPAERGALFDRNGNLLATNAVSYSYAVDPTQVEHPYRLGKLFASVLGGDSADYVHKITDDERAFVWIDRKVTGSAAERLGEIQDPGLLRMKEPVRRFEYGTIGAQMIGCTGIDNNGLSGVELFYNDKLKGRDGFIVMQRDARRHRRPDVDLPRVEPRHGDGLELTIDINVQGIVEDELRRGVERAKAESGTAVAIDPRTGEILAMASYPGFNPNDLTDADPAALRVRAITDTYEPGSTMKVVTAAAILEDGVMNVDDSIHTDGPVIHIGTHVIRDDHEIDSLTLRKALEESSNVGFATVATKLPEARFYKYVRDFGFGIVSGIDLPGEARGEVKKPNEFGPTTRQFMAFGYQLAVTPLQLCNAYATIANGGVMMKPHLLRRLLQHDGTVIEDVEPQEIRRVVSERTAREVTEMMVGVVERGTGRQAAVPGLRIAGKTGTSQQLSGGTYSKEHYNASFAGFFPADDPQVALVVLLDSPRNGYYGGQVAAPVFREIARRISSASLRGVRPDVRFASTDTTAIAPPDHNVRVPDLRGVQPDAAREIGERYGLRVVVDGPEAVVSAQTPDPDAVVEAGGVVTVTTGAADTTMRMPDVRGLAVRRALNLMNERRIRPRVSGSGIVRHQHPSPGVEVASDQAVVLECK